MPWRVSPSKTVKLPNRYQSPLFRALLIHNTTTMNTLFTEPAAIDLDSRVAVKQAGGLQLIHSKVIRSEADLCRLLSRRYGKKFEIEMRHNVYRIRTPSECAALDLVSRPPPTPSPGGPHSGNADVQQAADAPAAM